MRVCVFATEIVLVCGSMHRLKQGVFLFEVLMHVFKIGQSKELLIKDLLLIELLLMLNKVDEKHVLMLLTAGGVDYIH